MPLVIVVHGGAGGNAPHPEDRQEKLRQGVTKAALKGYDILRGGGRAIDAVEGAVVVLEDDPEFNAGCGSVLNEQGKVEMDAIIMDGKDLSSGAVSAVKRIANPIKLAHLVMEKTRHTLLTDQGAALFAKAMGVPEIPEEQLVTEQNLKRLEKAKLKGDQLPASEKDLGTVGAVAMDGQGNVAFATSTGGIVNKMIGRVGDSPCIGSGGYADNHIGAVSSTGHGESIMKVNLARLTLFHMEQGMSPEEAASNALNYMKTRVQGTGGLIVVSKEGEWTAKWSTYSMPWAAVKDGQLQYGLNPGEVCPPEALKA
ncbi:isoaspartyl peptidase/L-asparaginase [Ornithorhynchus anatinus]|uniref:Isoaspartyl peptidase/L-asparaginase n=1 Tax=Ornithorhynchus anatinus TaxID=9258 RepID=F7C6R0_ORNAN|nr:isoaspartyl peptidase/L-asparaginase [Ornithorhynchus anatinus]